MPDDPNLDNDETPGFLRQRMEEATAQAAAANAALAELQRKDAFRDAGIDYSNPLHVAVAKGYDGDLNAEAVKAYVDNTIGSMAPPPPPPTVPPAQQPPPNAEADAYGRLQQASTGVQTPPPGAQNAEAVAALIRRMDDLQRNGKIQELDAASVEYARLTGTDWVDMERMVNRIPQAQGHAGTDAIDWTRPVS